MHGSHQAFRGHSAGRDRISVPGTRARPMAGSDLRILFPDGTFAAFRLQPPGLHLLVPRRLKALHFQSRGIALQKSGPGAKRSARYMRLLRSFSTIILSLGLAASASAY